MIGRITGGVLCDTGITMHLQIRFNSKTPIGALCFPLFLSPLSDLQSNHVRMTPTPTRLGMQEFSLLSFLVDASKCGHVTLIYNLRPNCVRGRDMTGAHADMD